MDFAFALLLPLVGGYLFVTGCRHLKFKVAREEGHKLYFRVACHGIWLFLVAFALASLGYALVGEMGWSRTIEQFLANVAKPLLKTPEQAPGQIGFVLVCLYSVALGKALPLLVNRYFKRTQRDAHWDATSENELEGIHRIYEGREDAADDFRLALPIDKMLSLSFFDIAIYEQFKSEAMPQDRIEGTRTDAGNS